MFSISCEAVSGNLRRDSPKKPKQPGSQLALPLYIPDFTRFFILREPQNDKNRKIMENQALTKNRDLGLEVPGAPASKNLKSRIMTLAVPLAENLGLAQALLAERKVFDPVFRRMPPDFPL